MMTTRCLDEMMKLPEPDMMGLSINVVVIPLAVMVGVDGEVNYHVSLYPAPEAEVDPDTGYEFYE